MDNKYDTLIEKTISSETVFEGRVFTCLVKDVELADGSRSQREIVKHNGGACILPVDADMNAYVVRQFRSPFEKVLMEVLPEAFAIMKSSSPTSSAATSKSGTYGRRKSENSMSIRSISRSSSPCNS